MLKAARIYDDGRRTVIVVAGSEIRAGRGSAVLQLIARAEPVAIVVCAADGSRAIDMASQPLDLDRLIEKTAGLDVLLKR